MALISIASIYPTINWVNISEQTGCHAPLISDYFNASKIILTHVQVQHCIWAAPYIGMLIQLNQGVTSMMAQKR